MEQVNLVEEIVKLMERLEFNFESIQHFVQDKDIVEVHNVGASLQRGVIVCYFNNQFTMLPEMPHSDVRLALNTAHDPVDWLGDMGTYVLTFVKANEKYFFL